MVLFTITASGTVAEASAADPSDAPSPADHRKLIHDTIESMNKSSPYWPDMFTLRDLIHPEDLLILHEELLKGKAHSRRGAAWVLAHIHSDESVEPLRQALRTDKNVVVRWEAAHTLGYIRAIAAEPDLINALRTDPNTHVRLRAADALNMLETPTALRAIDEAMETDSHPGVVAALKVVRANVGFKRHEVARLRPGQITQGYHKGTRYLVYMPRGLPRRAKRKWLVVQHGTWGSPESYVKLARADAEQHRVMVLGMHLDYGQYSWFGTLNLRNGKPRPDLRLFEIIDALSHRARSDKRLLLFGHSEGGAFVNTMALVHPHRVERAAACATSTCYDPYSDEPFPLGMGICPVAPDLGPLNFKRLVRIPLAMVSGTEDSPTMRQKQQEFLGLIKKYAKEHRLKNRAVYIPVPGAGHSGSANYRAAREFLFEHAR
jgi:pimeloyl-ACP methyl ester carboxylesterase